ncbi:MAG: F0F1 ATP synthase subunit epsilon [Candidatus Eremiobacteraeota bacterium]|nr:F0F1 ATP synthase subunit epsilon [Candidatus Eremiobacteraeota bacterium]
MTDNRGKSENLHNILKLEIATPDGLFFKGFVKQVEIPGAEGRFTILPGHASLISVLQPGKLKYSGPGMMKIVQTGKGIMQVKHNHVIVVIESIK